MNVVYAFIGILPSYSIETVQQMRLFFDGPIYFIIDDYNSQYVPVLTGTYNVTIVRYDAVIDMNFGELLNTTYKKFCIVQRLKGREHLFIHAFQRFYLLANLMKQRALKDVFFLELDNLVYESPAKWLELFQEKPMAYMFDNYNRGASGIAYIQDTQILDSFLECCTNFITNSTEFINEMTVLYIFWEAHKDLIQLLPIHWESDTYPSATYTHIDKYKSVFDAAAIGVYIGGADPYHTGGVIQRGFKSLWSLIDYTVYQYKWEKDEKGRFIPYILNSRSGEWLKINNLHIGLIFKNL